MKLARDVTVDNLLDRGVELLGVLGIAEQTDLQLRFFCLAKLTQQILG